MIPASRRATDRTVLFPAQPGPALPTKIVLARLSCDCSREGICCSLSSVNAHSTKLAHRTAPQAGVVGSHVRVTPMRIRPYSSEEAELLWNQSQCNWWATRFC